MTEIIAPQELEALSKQFETAAPQEIIAWAVEIFWPKLALSSSFQTSSIPLLYMVHQIKPGIPIFFLETGYHYWDTLVFREKLAQEWGLNIIDLRYNDSWSNFLLRFGRDLPDTDPGLCCYLRKVQPMQKATIGLDAWITGIRRDQTENRAGAQILEVKREGLVRIAPLLNWTRDDLETFILEYNLPRHPLPADEFPSVGCKPCTRPVQPGEGERAGRWSGKGKTECGLHTELFNKERLTAADFKLGLDED